MVDLELCPPGAAAKAEEKWIVKLRSSGNPLLNVMLREGRLDQRMVILLQPSQLRQLKDRAKAVGLSASEYLRRLLCDEPIPATAC